MARDPLMLEVLDGPNQGAQMQWTSPDLLIGSSFDCDVVLMDDAVEGYHLRLQAAPGGGFVIVDSEDGIEWLEPASDISEHVAIPCEMRVGATRLRIMEYEDQIDDEDEADDDEATTALSTMLVKEKLEDAKTAFNSLADKAETKRDHLYSLAQALVVGAFIFAVIALVMTIINRPEAPSEPLIAAPYQAEPVTATTEADALAAQSELETLIRDANFDMVNAGVIDGQLEVWGIVPDSRYDAWLGIVDQYERTYGMTQLLHTDVVTASESNIISQIALISLGTNPSLRTKSGRTLRPGDRIGDDWVLETISAEGIELKKGPRGLLLKLM